jgi:WhiB family redox-sensing transcriptional regulator
MKLPVRAEMLDHLTIIVEDCNAQAHWRKHAACRGMDTNLFYPEQGFNGHVKQRQAQAVCAGCPVQAECLQALGRYSGGIVGGQTTAQRTKAHMIKSNLELLQLRDHIIATEPLEIAAHDLGITPESLRRHNTRHPEGVST